MNSRPNNLRINQEERRFLGVCAGIADYLDMPVVLVRIIFIISMLTWPALIIAYFALYFWLDRDLSADKVYNWLSGSTPTQHLKNLDYRRPLYRNMRNRKIAGVCSGIADYLEVRPVLIRAAAIASAFVMGPYALLAYGVCWFVMEPNPATGKHHRHADRYARRKARHERRQAKRRFSSSRINTGDDEELDAVVDEAYSKAAVAHEAPGQARRTDLHSPRLSTSEKTIEECADIYYALENRLRTLEACITSKKFRLHCEINRI